MIKIDVNQDVTSRLKLEPSKDHSNFCIGKVDAVELTFVEIADDRDWEFKGMTVPRFAIHFTNHKLNKDEVDRGYSFSELPIARFKKDGSEIKGENYSLMVVEMWKRLKHIHDAFKSSPNYRPIANIPEFTDDPTSAPEKRIEEFTAFFTAIKNAFVGDEAKGEKPVWVGADGNSIPLTMKLIATDGKSSQYLAFPKFVGEGFIQPFQLVDGKLKTTLRFRPNETVVLQNISTAAPIASSNPVPGMENVPQDILQSLRGNQ